MQHSFLFQFELNTGGIARKQAVKCLRSFFKTKKCHVAHLKRTRGSSLGFLKHKEHRASLCYYYDYFIFMM